MTRYASLPRGQKTAVHLLGVLMVVGAALAAIWGSSLVHLGSAHADTTAVCTVLCARTGSGQVGAIGTAPFPFSRGSGSIGVIGQP